MKRIFLYARVSTTNHGQDPEMQLREMREACRRQGWTAVEEFVDRLSGTTRSRPELDRMMKLAEAHGCDVVMVWKFDRFARSTIHLAQALEQFKSWGVGFVSVTEQVDTATPAGKLVFTILGACAEMEREIIVERINAGLRNAVAKGVRLGRPPLKISARVVQNAVREQGTLMAAAAHLGISYGKVQGVYKEAVS